VLTKRNVVLATSLPSTRAVKLTWFGSVTAVTAPPDPVAGVIDQNKRLVSALR
jgi:hypothetical protein